MRGYNAVVHDVWLIHSLFSVMALFVREWELYVSDMFGDVWHCERVGAMWELGGFRFEGIKITKAAIRACGLAS